MHSHRTGFVFSLTALCAFCSTSAASARISVHGTPVVHGPQFEDASALLDFIRVDETMSAKLAGVAWIDFDDDDDLDLYLVNAPGGDNALYRNDDGAFTNVAASAGVTGNGSGYTGALAGDINNDGHTDLFLTGAGGFFGLSFPHRLYINKGDGTFVDRTAQSGIDPNHIGLMSALGDIDGDGFLDLFVASPGNFATSTLTPQKLYHNNGDGTFTDISAAAGIDTSLGACVAAFSDFNGDQLPDILVGNCNDLDLSGPQAVPIPGPWELWINQGDLTFVNQADEAGLNARPGFPMALTVADYDSDGDLDIFATGAGVLDPFGGGGILGEQVLFQNRGNGTFVDATYASGLGGFEFSWGGSFGDFDNDGDQDLATVGSVAVSFMQLLGDFAGPGRVYENDGSGQMTATIDLGLEFHATSGLAVADFDMDGFQDLILVRTAFDLPATPWGPLAGSGAPVLMRNKGNSNRSVTVKLVGHQSNSMAIGARVRAFVPGRGMQIQEVVAGSSFASTCSPWLTFGLGNRKFALIAVDWPAGGREWFFAHSGAGALKTLEEGSGYSF